MQSRFIFLVFLTLSVQIPTSKQKLLLGRVAVDDDFFGQGSIQGSAWRTIGYDEVNDPKTIFFLGDDSNDDNKNTEENDPSRGKRQADDHIVDAETVAIKRGTEGDLTTQKEESESQDTLQLSTEGLSSTTEIVREDEFSKNNFIPINDFIRFRRELVENKQEQHGSNGQSRSFELDHEDDDTQNSRGPRGLSTQQWVKFPYQIERSQKSDDSFVASSEFAKPRRVQFVTKKQFQVEDPSASSNSRQGRVSDHSRHPVDQPREPREPEIRKGPSSFAPRFRDFDGPSEYAFRSSRGRYYERELMDRRPDSRSFEFYPRNRDRRIIYYANLPEITRDSPRFGEMGRFRDYRDPFDDRYRGDQYRRGFYRDRVSEELHPLKVSTDINVRDVKKNPEKRIYSDVKRKYDYDAPTFDSNQPMRH